MSDWVDHAEANGFPQRGGASEAELTQIGAAFTRQFQIPLPPDYADLLRTSNGFEFDGVVIFGTRDQDDAAGFLPGLFDSNERLIHGVSSVETPLLFIGEAGDALLAFDTDETQWKAVSRYGWHPLGRFSTFGELFNATLAPTH